MPKAMTMAATTPMPASGAGIALVSFGSAQMIAMVNATSANMV